MLPRGLKYLKVATKLILYLLAILLAIVAYWNYLFGYRSSDIYTCEEAKELRFSFPAGRFGTNILLVGHLEVYVGGWISRGSLELTGTPFRDKEPKHFSATDRVSTVSHAYIGEWYDPDFSVGLKPSEGANCAMKVIYRFE